jgi:hypothetical protein
LSSLHQSSIWASGVSFLFCPSKRPDIDFYPADRNEDNYQQVYENGNFDENKASLGHEVIAGGAAFAGFKAFEDHQRKEGKHIYLIGLIAH